MNTEELNTTLYEKMFAEQERFVGQLKAQSPKEILKHAYEYVIREDFLCSLENNDLSPQEARALLKLDEPLAELFKEWDNRETTYMDGIWDTLSDKAWQLKEASKSDPGKER